MKTLTVVRRPDFVRPARQTYAPEPTTEIIDEDVLLVEPDGTVIGASVRLGGRKQLLSELTQELRLRLSWDDGLGGSSQARLSGILTTSRVFGFTEPKPLRWRYGGSMARLHADFPRAGDMLKGLTGDLWEVYEEVAPDAAAEHRRIMEERVHPDWWLGGAPWTSGVVNKDTLLPYHVDRGNFTGTWSAMLALRKGVDGGHLHLPEYGVTLAIPDTSVTIFNGQKMWHGVTPMNINRSGYRFTMVWYAKSKMAECVAVADEVHRAALRATANATDKPRVVVTKPPKRKGEDAPAVDPEWMWRAFADFCLYELAAGGPDPHMRYVGWLSRDESWDERVWRMGVYVNVYNTATAEVIWQHWPWRAVRDNKEAFAAWLSENWGGIVLRRERRAARTPAKLTASLLAYRAWAGRRLPAVLKTLSGRRTEADYETMWTEAMNLPTMGRYAAFKLIEALARYADVPVDMFDIRAPGGFSPRLTLALLMPEAAEAIAPYDDGHEACRASELAAAVIRERLVVDEGIEADWYRLEVFLCDFRQSWEGKRQYPGRSNDSEMEYLSKAVAYWGDDRYTPGMLTARAELTPERCRGEDRGWDGVRKELGAVLRDYRYTWSDLRYDYPTDLSNPREVDRGGAQDPRNLAQATLVAR